MQLGVLLAELGIRRFEDEFSSGRHRVARVDDEVHEHLLELTRVGQHIPGIPRERESQLHILADQTVQHLFKVLDEPVWLEDHRLEHLLAAERQKLFGE